MVMCKTSFIFRENPDKLFEVFLEVGKPASEEEGTCYSVVY